MLVSIIVAIFLAAHALIHTGFVSARPAPTPGAPPWPFDLGHSWALGSLGVDEPVTRVIGTGLLVVLMLAYAVAALAVLGVVPTGLFVPAIAIGSVASLAMLGVFFHPWLLIGIAIDLVLLWATLVGGWRPGPRLL